MPRFVIYCHTNKVNGKKYVGQTRSTMALRWSGHVHAALKRKDQNYFCNAIRKHGVDAFVHEVLDVVMTEAGADLAEALWIVQKQSRAPAGYNLSSGGESPAVHETTRIKISESWGDSDQRKKRADNIRAALNTPDTHALLVASAKRREAAYPAEVRARLDQRLREQSKAMPPISKERCQRTSHNSKDMWAQRSEEERAAVLAPMRAALAELPLEYKQAAAMKMNDRHAQRTPEERRALALKAWETKRARYGDNQNWVRRCLRCGKWGHYVTTCGEKKENI